MNKNDNVIVYDNSRVCYQVSLMSFATYVLMGGVMDAGIAFTSLTLFNILRFPISLLPVLISYLVTVSYASIGNVTLELILFSTFFREISFIYGLSP